MNIKKLAAILSLSPLCLWAEEIIETEIRNPVKWSVSSTYFSEYLARPGFILYDQPVSQNELVATWKSIYAGLWSSIGLEESRIRKYDQEYQAYLGYKKALGWVLLDGNIRYDVLKELSTQHDDLWMCDLRMDIHKLPVVQPYIATRYFHGVGQNDVSGGWLVWLGVRRVQDLGFGIFNNEHVRLIVDGSVAHSDGVLDRDSGWVYGRLNIQLAAPITKRFALGPQLVVQVPLDDQGKGRKPYTDGTVKVVWGIGASFKF